MENLTILYDKSFGKLKCCEDQLVAANKIINLNDEEILDYSAFVEDLKDAVRRLQQRLKNVTDEYQQLMEQVQNLPSTSTATDVTKINELKEHVLHATTEVKMLRNEPSASKEKERDVEVSEQRMDIDDTDYIMNDASTERDAQQQQEIRDLRLEYDKLISDLRARYTKEMDDHSSDLEKWKACKEELECLKQKCKLQVEQTAAADNVQANSELENVNKTLKEKSEYWMKKFIKIHADPKPNQSDEEVDDTSSEDPKKLIAKNDILNNENKRLVNDIANLVKKIEDGSLNADQIKEVKYEMEMHQMIRTSMESLGKGPSDVVDRNDGNT